MKDKILLEVCCGDIDSVVAAKAGGADRIELCCALGEGGLTPSYGMLTMALDKDIPVNILVRPRRGDFCYSDIEVESMVGDICMAGLSGVDGIVVGALTPEGDIDIAAMEKLLDEAGGLDVTFHRAFDMCRDPESALEALIKLGCHNVLTSGFKPNALDGIENLRQLVIQADGRINIIAGCGVTPRNAEEIISRTGVCSIHATCSKVVESRMSYRRKDVNMGNVEDEYSRKTSDVKKIRELRKIIDNIR